MAVLSTIAEAIGRALAMAGSMGWEILWPLVLGLILAFVMGWQFTVAEFVGGPIMIILVALGFRVWMRGRIVTAARAQADTGVAGSMEGHAGMDMSAPGEGTFLQRLFSRSGLVSVSQYFVMDWAAVLRDIVLGLLIAGAFAAWVPAGWLQAAFATNDPTVAFLIGPLIGPLLAAVSFVCSVGNVPLAAVLWNGGISFGGVVSFIFADLIIVPIILIYRKYYGAKAALRITAIFYGAMVAAGYLVELVFTPLGLVPGDRHLTIATASISWNYTTWLNISFLAIATVLLVIFFRSGSGSMLRMMNGAPNNAVSDQDSSDTYAEHTRAGEDHDR